MTTSKNAAHMLHRSTKRRNWLLAGAATAAIMAGVTSAQAVDYTVGDYQISLDTTLSSSVGFRTSDVDKRFIGDANGGRFPAANFDNGDLNFRTRQRCRSHTADYGGVAGQEGRLRDLRPCNWLL